MEISSGSSNGDQIERPSRGRDRIILESVILTVAAAYPKSAGQQAVRQVRDTARAEDLPLIAHIRRTDEPTSVSVLLEDSAAPSAS